MRDDSQPILEALVFAAALLLAVVIGYYGYMRWSAGGVPAEPPAAEMPAPTPASDAASEESVSTGSGPVVRDMAPSLPAVRATIPRKKRRPSAIP